MTGDKLASGAKSASFSTSDKSMTKEQWDAMFEPESKEGTVYQIADQCPVNFEEKTDTGVCYWHCILPPNHDGPHEYFRPEKLKG